MVNIRRAQEKDINKIVDLLYQVHQVHVDGRPDIFKAGARKYTTPELLELLQNEQKPIFVAVNAQDEVVGYAFCVYQVTANAAALQDRKILFIDDLCVDSACRGQNVGLALYQFVEKEAKTNHCHSMTLQVWNFNEGAMRFYEKTGFHPLKTWMEKPL